MIGGLISLVLYFLGLTWWILFFLAMLPIFLSTLVFWRQQRYKSGSAMDSVLLELRVPREITKSARAMEQILTGMHSLRNAAGDVKERYYEGEVTKWFSLEMVSFGGEVHFYLRTPKKLRNLVEASFFSYYRDVEVSEAPDYVDKLPNDTGEMYAQGYDLWGTEMVLAKDSHIPIRTYVDFETTDEETQFDPIATFLEILGGLKKEETVGIQILIAPGDRNWNQGGKEWIKQMKSREVGTKESRPAPRSPGETDILKAIEKNISKPAFDTLIRFLYFSPQATFSDNFARRGLTGAFNQYASLHLNAFRPNFKTQTRTRIWNRPHIFPKTRLEYKKQRLLYNYKLREVPPETWMGRLITSHLFNWNFASERFYLNTEALATLFHPPTTPVLTAPHLKRVESRKVGPPSGLPIYGEEDELEKFL